MRFVAIILLISFAMAWHMSDADSPLVELVPLRVWRGQQAEIQVLSMQPQHGFITDSATWRTLWQAWQGVSMPCPDVDFANALLLVATAPGPNSVRLRAYLHNNGDVRTRMSSTRKAGPGFGFTMMEVAREGVRSVSGQAIETTP